MSSINSQTLQQVFTMWGNQLNSQINTFHEQCQDLREAELELSEFMDYTNELLEETQEMTKQFDKCSLAIDQMTMQQNNIERQVEAMESAINEQLLKDGARMLGNV